MTMKWQTRYTKEFSKRPAKAKPARQPRPDPTPELPKLGQRVSVPLAHNETRTGRVLAVYAPSHDLPTGMVNVVGRSEFNGNWSLCLFPRDLERHGEDWKFRRANHNGPR